MRKINFHATIYKIASLILVFIKIEFALSCMNAEETKRNCMYNFCFFHLNMFNKQLK